MQPASRPNANIGVGELQPHGATHEEAGGRAGVGMPALALDRGTYGEPRRRQRERRGGPLVHRGAPGRRSRGTREPDHGGSGDPDRAVGAVAVERKEQGEDTQQEEGRHRRPGAHQEGDRARFRDGLHQRVEGQVGERVVVGLELRRGEVEAEAAAQQRPGVVPMVVAQVPVGILAESDGARAGDEDARGEDARPEPPLPAGSRSQAPTPASRAAPRRAAW